MKKPLFWYLDMWANPSIHPQLTDKYSLLPLIDKPLLQLVVEQLVKLGCHDFHVLLGEQPTPVREFLGVGERWGIKVTYHYQNAELDLARNLKHLCLVEEEMYWLACPDLMPQDVTTPSTLASSENSGTALCWESGSELHWSGWGYVTGAWLASLHEQHSLDEVALLILNDKHFARQLISQPLSVMTDSEYLRSSMEVLENRLKLSGQSTHVGRGAVIHPSVQIIGAVHIGRQTCIEANVKLGPNVIVCDGAFIDQGTELTDSIVLPDTYVGTQLELNFVIAAPGKLSSIANQVVLNRVEPSFLASVNGQNEKSQTTNQSYFMAWVIKVILFPVYVLVLIVNQIAGLRAPTEKRMHIPDASLSTEDGSEIEVNVSNTLPGIYAQEQGAFVSHFLHTFYVGLSEVARGRIALYGPELRTVADTKNLPVYWKSLYQQHRCGLLSESLLLPIEPTHHSGRYAYDAYAVTDDSAKYQYSILLRYLGVVSHDCYQTLFHSK